MGAAYQKLSSAGTNDNFKNYFIFYLDLTMKLRRLDEHKLFGLLRWWMLGRETRDCIVFKILKIEINK